jgi:peroxiredoxin
MRYGISLLAALIVWSSACAAPAPAAPAAPATTLTSLPATHLEGLDGQTTDLASAVGGRAALVSLWATWCDSCIAEVDALGRLDAQTRERGDAVVLAVAVGEPRATVAAFARDRAVRYRVLVDPEFALSDALGQRRVPATLVFDRGGRIVFRGGALDAAGLAAFREAASAPRHAS